VKLGEAYVNIRADLRPYVRDLNAGLRATTAAFEKQLNKELGRRFGKEISTGARESLVAGAKETAKQVEKELGGLGGGSGGNTRLRAGLRRSTKVGLLEGFTDALGSGAKLFTFIASALASALDDGISALPVQVKAALVAGVLAASPAILAGLTALINSAVAIGVAGIGIALASQLTPVSDTFEKVVDKARDALAASAGPLIQPLVNGMNAFLAFVEQRIAPRLQVLFAEIAPGLETVLLAITATVDRLFTTLSTRGVRIDGILDAVADSVVILGAALSESLKLLLDSGTDGENALRDLAMAAGGLLVIFSAFLRVTTEVYGRLRDIALLLSGDLQGFIMSQINREIESTGDAAKGAADDFSAWVSATDEETKALKENAKASEAARRALEKLTDEAFDSINAEINLAESWDEVTAAIKENGRTLDLDKEKGRENARAAEDYIRSVREAYKKRVQDGEITAEQAEIQIQREIDKLGDLFGKTGESRREFERLFGAVEKLILLELDPSGWTAFFNKIGGAIRTTIGLLNTLQNKQNQTEGPGGRGGGGSSRGYAGGGRVTFPQTVDVGEGFRPEIILPETRPARAARILADSSLSSMLGGTTNVSVFIGNEQLAARQYAVAQGVNRQAARTLSQAPRMV
jgi:hypothetical protein